MFRSLLSRAAVYGVIGAAKSIAAVLMLPLFTAHLQPADFGVVALLNTAGLMMTPVLSLGFGASLGVCFFKTQDEREQSDVVLSAAVVLLVSGLAILGLGYTLRHVLSQLLFRSPEYGPHVTLAFANAAATVAFQTWPLALQFRERLKAFVVQSVAGLVVTVGTGLLFVVYLDRGAIGLLQSVLLGTISGGMVAAALNYRHHGRPTRRWISLLMKHGIPMVPAFAFLFVMQEAAKVPLGSYWGATELGLFSLGWSLGSAVQIMSAAFVSAWNPYALRLVNADPDAARLALGRYAFYYLLIAGFAVGTAFALAQLTVRLIAQPDYLGAADVIGLAALTQVISSLFILLLPPLYQVQRVHIVTPIQGVASIAAVILWFVFIPRFGAVGAGAAIACSFAVQLLLTYLVISRMWRDQVVQIEYPWLRIGCYALGLAAFCTVVASTSSRFSMQAPVAGEALVAAGQLLVLALFTLACAGRGVIRHLSTAGGARL